DRVGPLAGDVGAAEGAEAIAGPALPGAPRALRADRAAADDAERDVDADLVPAAGTVDHALIPVVDTPIRRDAHCRQVVPRWLPAGHSHRADLGRVESQEARQPVALRV